MRLAVDLGRRILGTFAPMSPPFRRFLYMCDAPPINRALAPRILPEGGSGDRRYFLRFHEDPMRSAVDLRRLIMGKFPPIRRRFRRLLYISDASPLNRALAPGMLPGGGSGGSRDFSRFPADPMRMAIDLGRRILGPFAPLAPLFRRLLYISDARPLNLASCAENSTGRRIRRSPGFLEIPCRS